MKSIQVSTNDLAELFSLTPRRIQQLNSEGVLHGEGRPLCYDLAESVQAYSAYLIEREKYNTSKSDIADLELKKLMGDVRLKRAQAEKAELELFEMEADLFSAKDVEAITTAHVAYLRSRLECFPDELAIKLSGTHSAAEQAATLRKAVYVLLNDLAEWSYTEDENAS